MELKKLISRGLLIAAVSSLVIAGCRKKDEDKDTQAASDNEQAEFMSNDVVNMSDAAANGVNSFKNNPSGTFAALSCATVTRDTIVSSDPDTTTIDFGSSACQCMDGRYRQGKIIVIHHGKFTIPQSFRSVSFSNYFVGKDPAQMHQIEGVHTVTFNGKNTAGNFNWTIDAQNMKITRPDGKYHTWTSTRNREWIQGSNTPFNWTDDVFLITGSASGTNVNGNSYSANITTALRRELGCHWFVSGTVEITPQNKPTRTVDYGNGTCDNQATVTIGNNTYTITLH